MTLDFILLHPELQAVVSLLVVGFAVIALREPKLAGRWSFVFLLLLISVFTPGTSGFVFLLAAETFSYLAFEETDALEPAARTWRFIINVSLSTVCLLTAVVLNQTIHVGASIPIFVWIYFSFIGLPFSLARTRGSICKGSILVYLFCFTLCFKDFVGNIDAVEWSTVLLAFSAFSILAGNARATAALAVLALCGLSPLHLVFAIPYLITSVAPGLLVLTLLPIGMMCWISAALPTSEILSITLPGIFIFAGRAAYVEKPTAILWRWVAPTLVSVLLFSTICYLNWDLLTYLYDKVDIGSPIYWGGLALGLLLWNFLDRRIAWFAVGVKEWKLPSALSSRYESMKKPEEVDVLEMPLWQDVIPSARGQVLLRGHVQLTAWFAVMLAVVSLFYWLAV